MTEHEKTLDDADRVLLKEAMDIIIPPVDDLPGAGEMGLAQNAEEIADRIPEYGLAVRRVLDATCT